MKTGIVIKSTGSWYKILPVENDVEIQHWSDEDVVEARIKGKFRLAGLPITNPIAVGDVVDFEIEQEEKGMIKHIHPRKNYVARQSPRKKHELHLLSSNVDQAVLVVSLKYPDLKMGFIDRFLLMTEPQDIPVIILVNKIDLLDEDDFDLLGGLAMMYEKIGYQVLPISATKGDGIEQLKEILKGKQTLISGQSGVGKSTLLNALENSLDIKVAPISDYMGKGQHTTTFAEMHSLSFGARIIDTPGIKTLSFNNLEPQDVAHNYREFFIASENCKFGGNCLHRNEPKCAVKEAIESGEISDIRYASYLQILEEVEAQNYWERHKKM